MRIRKLEAADVPAVVELSLRAWAPVFVSLKQALNPAVYQAFYPDWRVCQRQAVESACAELAERSWVADDSGRVVAFVAVKIHPADRMGEIHMLAVDPASQQGGIGKALTEFALDAMRGEDLALAMVETGGDPGHGPARHTYEQCGFELFPVARYFQKL
jgi:ribosomal protein S18 acetylase RimI-like enzyme